MVRTTGAHLVPSNAAERSFDAEEKFPHRIILDRIA